MHEIHAGVAAARDGGLVRRYLAPRRAVAAALCRGRLRIQRCPIVGPVRPRLLLLLFLLFYVPTMRVKPPAKEILRDADVASAHSRAEWRQLTAQTSTSVGAARLCAGMLRRDTDHFDEELDDPQVASLGGADEGIRSGLRARGLGPQIDGRQLRHLLRKRVEPLDVRGARRSTGHERRAAGAAWTQLQVRARIEQQLRNA